ncbi:3-isopropylmalate dehydratase large subunit [Sphingomonas sp. GB1N7]|uniref:3-isopropylmalate dehydratase large subunit n=1 Tax=Parasphingomonas caseinilytica TaxID=3096158 RepID=UPI002FC702E4
MTQSLFDKLWAQHVVEDLGDMNMIAIDLHLLHDLSGPSALKALADRGLAVDAPGQTFAIPDHGVATIPGRTDQSSEASRKTLPPFRRFCAAAGIRLFDLDSPDQGIVHVVAPELGLTLPGLTIVCGDSHTCTQGAFGALAWGIGSTEIMQVLATQMLILEKPRSMRVWIDGALRPDADAKDLILHIIGRWGAAGAVGHALEFAGPAVDAMSMEQRMSLCNLAVEFGARFGLIAPDATTIDYLKGRPYAPAGSMWDDAVSHWIMLGSDEGAVFDSEVTLDASIVGPQITWGVTLDHVIGLAETVPGLPDDPAAAADIRHALDYMGIEAAHALTGTRVDQVFIGSCANGRLSDLEAAAAVVRGRSVAPGVVAWIVPGSQGVRRAAEARGLDRDFRAAGFEWREPGCSMCLAMNGDMVPSGARCVSTSNRNFVGRQGPGARTHLASPATAAACAIAGRIAAPGDLAEVGA